MDATFNDVWVVIDTNVLLHYQWPEDWDSNSLLDGKARLIFVPLIFRELEKRQYQDSSERMRERARKVLRRLTDLFVSPAEISLRNGIIAAPVATEPTLDFSEHSLSREIADDYLIAHLIELKSAGRKVALLSADGPAAFKAKLRSFHVIRPDVSWLLPVEPSKEERELQQLRAEKSAQPKLSLTICGAKKIDAVSLECKVIQQWTAQDRDHILKDVFRQLPGIPAGKKLTFADQELLRENEATITSWTQYVEDLDRYRRQIIVELPFAVWNGGSRSAEDVHIRVSTTARGTFADKLPDEPKSPDVPEESYYERLARDIVPLGKQFAQVAGKEPVLESILSRDGTQSLEMSIAIARQEYTTDLVTIYLLFETEDDVSSFSFDWEIRASNIGAPVRGQLHVRVTKTEAIAGPGQHNEPLLPVPCKPLPISVK